MRPGDQITLKIIRDTVVAFALDVGPRGFVVLPLAGDVHMGGVAGSSVQDSVRAALTRFVAPGAIEARLLRRIRVIGEVARPGVLFVDRTYTLRDAMALAGGPTEAGDAKVLVVERAGSQRRIADWHTDASALDAVESGDQLMVPRLPWYRRNASFLMTSAATILATVLLAATR